MRIGSFDTRQKVLIVAEVGNNHEGDVSLARELVARAAEAGVDAVKFQTFRADDFGNPTDRDRLARLRQFELSRDDFEDLAHRARDAGLMFMSTPLDMGSAEFLSPIVDAMKIASGDLTFVPLLERAAQSHKPVILSTGLATFDEINASIHLVEENWKRDGVSPGLAVLHCVSAYPAPNDQANLSSISALARMLDCTVGYSDHTIGIQAASLAVMAGARIIEKHFTIDRHYSTFRDHQLSADPEMMRAMVDMVRQAETMMGSVEQYVQDCEADGRTAYRRSIVAARDLPAGTIVERTDITWLRPGTGFSPGHEDKVVGKRLSRPLSHGTPFADEDFQSN